MMTNEQWVTAWRDASHNERFALFEREARKVLTAEPIDTKRLAELMFPELSQRGPGIDCRKSMVQHLMKLAKGSMSDCASKDMTGEPRMWYGKAVRPWIWKSGTAKIRERCPHCHGKGYMSESDTEATRQEEIKQDMAQTIA